MTKVSLLRCTEYLNETLRQKIEESFENIDFDLSTLNNKRVVIKPNLLLPADDEKAMMTHSEFFRATVQVVKEHNGIPVLVESPILHSLNNVLKRTKYGKIVEDEGVETADPKKTRTLHYDGANIYKHIDISKAYFDADILIMLPKFKTHGITYITGGVKLLFGAIPGFEKSKMHWKIPVHKDFSNFLLDLYAGFRFGFEKPKPMLFLMDAIIGQEGEGPGAAGTPVRMNAILASESAIALDYVATRAAKLDFNKVETIKEGFNRNYDIISPEEIEVVGDTIDSLNIDEFTPAIGSSRHSNAFQWPLNTRIFKKFFVERPVPSKKECSLCYNCMRICPAEAIEEARYRGKAPQYNYGKCIRCYCCVEVCPEAAIKKRNGKLQFLMPR